MNCLNCSKPLQKNRKYCNHSCQGYKQFTGKKHKREVILSLRCDVWKFGKEILEKYESGDAIQWLAREYGADKKTIRNILVENGITQFRGRAGIKAWNKGKRMPHLSGSKCHLWKGGVTPLRIQVRRCARYKNWVKSILERDNYSCRVCGKRGGNKEVDHHPKTFASIMEENNIVTLEEAHACSLLWDMDNGRTLCKTPCHRFK